MKAFVMNGYGGPERTGFVDVPAPEPRSGELRVRVRAAGLNPVDFKTRQGKLKAIQRYSLPAVMGNEFAGEVDKCGPGVTKFQVGDRVLTRVAKGRMGALAEFAIAEVDKVAQLPERMSFTTAAGIPLAGLTALQVLRDELKLKAGERVLITAGAGGVGCFAIQIAKAMGVHVIVTASARGAELVKSLGADEVIDYTQTDFKAQLSGLDGAFDLVGGPTLESCLQVVKRGGTVVSIAGVPEPQTARIDLKAGAVLQSVFWLLSFGLRQKAERAGVGYRYFLMHPSAADLEELLGLYTTGKLKVVIDSEYDFDALPQAFARLEQGRAKGKIVVRGV